MFIRGTRVQTPPEKIDAAIANFKQQVLPAVRATTGNVGAALLVDRETGAGIGITYWESAKALAASEQMGITTRVNVARNVAGTQVVNVERYEIVIAERAQPPQSGTFVRVNTVNAEPDKLVALMEIVRGRVLPTLKPLKGFRSLIMGIDRTIGRSAVSTTWDTMDDLKASEEKIAGLRIESARAGGADTAEVEIFESAVIDLMQTAAVPAG
jgi:quinol monooxygenase YgiN